MAEGGGGVRPLREKEEDRCEELGGSLLLFIGGDFAPLRLVAPFHPSFVPACFIRF